MRKHQKKITWFSNGTTSIKPSSYQFTIWEIQQIETTSRNHWGQGQNCMKSGIIKELPWDQNSPSMAVTYVAFWANSFVYPPNDELCYFYNVLFFIISKVEVRIRSFNSGHFLECNFLNYALFGDFSYFGLILCLKWTRNFLGFHKAPSPPQDFITIYWSL